MSSPYWDEHRAWWTMKKLNFDLTEASGVRILQLSKLEEIWAKPYESARSYKKRAKLFHDRHILRKKFTLGIKCFYMILFRKIEVLMDRSVCCFCCFSLWCSRNQRFWEWCQVQSKWLEVNTIFGVAKFRRCGVLDTLRADLWWVMNSWLSSSVSSTWPSLIDSSSFFPLFSFLILFCFFLYIFNDFLFFSTYGFLLNYRFCFYFSFLFDFFPLLMRTLCDFGMGVGNYV